MPTATNKSTDPILVLPWNRLPNFLILSVALVNLLVGITTVCVAVTFATSLADFEDVIAAATTGLYGLMLIWVAWCFRKGLLPLRYVADAGRRECGFRFGPWWNGRFDVSSASTLVGELRPNRDHDKWHWAILIPAPAPGGEAKDKWIYGSGKAFASADSAAESCHQVLAQLGEHFSLPFEIRPQ